MIVATAWNHDPLRLHTTAMVSALNECLCCLNDLRLRLWRAQQSGSKPSSPLLAIAIESIETEAREFLSEVLSRPTPATLVVISDTLTVPSASSPDVLNEWIRMRVGDLVGRLRTMSGEVGSITEFLIEDAATRIEMVCDVKDLGGGAP